MSAERRGWCVGLMLLVGVLSSGCRPKEEPPVQETPVEEQPAQPAGAAYDADALDALIQSLHEKARQLPGRTSEAHRDAMYAVFDEMTQALPILAGPEPTGAFDQNLRTLATARDRLSRDAGGASIDPAIDTGLRAAAGALRRIAQDDLFETPEITGPLDKLSATIEELDNVRTIGRPYIAADAVRLMVQSMRQMSQRLAEQAGIGAAPSPDQPNPSPQIPPSRNPEQVQ